MTILPRAKKRGNRSNREHVERLRSALSDPLLVCIALGVAEGHRKQATGVTIRCPAHEDRTPSCSVTVANNTIRVHCFGCTWSTDVFGLIAVVHGLDLRRDFSRILIIAKELASNA